MDAAGLVTLVGQTTRCDPVRALLGGAPLEPVGQSQVALHPATTVSFEPMELGDTDLAFLESVCFGEASPYADDLPYGVRCGGTHAEVREKLGVEPSSLGPFWEWFERDGRKVFVEYAKPDFQRAWRFTFSVRDAKPAPLRIPWSRLGFSRSTAPRHIALRLAPPSVIEDVAGREVTSIAAFVSSEGPMVAADGGLFDERTFGPLPRNASGGPVIEPPELTDVRSLPQARRFGTIRFDRPILHPWLHAHLASLADPLGLDEEQLRDILVGELGVIVSDDEEPRVVSPYEEEGDLVTGEEAMVALAEHHGYELAPGTFLTKLPVLPAGLRPCRIRRDGKVGLAEATLLYQYLVLTLQKDCYLHHHDAPAIVLKTSRGLVIDAVRALLVSGLRATEDANNPFEAYDRFALQTDDARDDSSEPDEPDEPPAIPPLAAALMTDEARARLRELDQDVKEDALALSARRFHLLRATLAASGLELVPLHPDGTVNEEALERTRINRFEHVIDAIYEEVIGIARVFDPSFDRPHADVFLTPPRPDGTRLLVTGGASALGPDVDEADVFELVFVIPEDLEERFAHELANVLLRLARQPAFRPAILRGGGVRLREPLVPGCPLDVLLFSRATEPPFDLLSEIIPRTPTYLFVVGAISAHHASRRDHERPISLVTDPRPTRASQ